MGWFRSIEQPNGKRHPQNGFSFFDHPIHENTEKACGRNRLQNSDPRWVLA
jgi:hypothetical protein